jgi:hypothetical protein
MSLTQGAALPDVTVKQTAATTAPDYYTNYLSNLATTGQAQVTGAAADPSKMVAGFGDLQNATLKAAPSTLAAYATPLQAGEATAAEVAKGVGGQQIANFMNPYTSGYTNAQGVKMPGVVDEMERLQQQNIQRNIMPQLKAGFVGTGGLGGQRYANALGQSTADMQSNLLGAQTGALQQGYKDAMNAALQQAQIQNQTAMTQGQLANIEATAGQSALKTGMDLGGQEQAQRQAVINAPLTTAANAAQLLRGYTVPTSTSQEYKGPLPGSYSASPLQQIAGLGALFASGSGGTSPFQGFQKALNSILSNSNSGSSVGTIFPGLDPTFNYEGSVQTEDGLGSV